MFLFHTAFSLGMIALTSGTALYAWSVRNQGPATGLAKFIGALVIIFSIISTLCTVYYGVKYWQAGYFQMPMAMNGMISDSMPMPNMMNQQSMMGNMSSGIMNSGMNSSNQSKKLKHEAHHPQ